MPRYEILAHVTCELEGETAEEAAALFQRQVLAKAGIADKVLQLAVWRQDPAASASPLPTPLRQQLIDFFAALERSAAEAEATFRERVEAILAVPGPAAARAADPSETPRITTIRREPSA
jgi:hypothetical protein